METNYTEDDPLGETDQMPVPGLIHRYRDRVVLLVSKCCAVHCRFCLRKRFWRQDNTAQYLAQNLTAVGEYLQQHQEIKEILISGGDPLLLENEELTYILETISKIKNIVIIRLGSRTPVTLPMRINQTLIRILQHTPGLWVATHFNHPREITAESTNACRNPGS